MKCYVRPNNHGDFSEWWGKGGCELWDELDPKCLTEMARDEVGPFDMEVAGHWDARARAIPGYVRQPSGGCAIVFRQVRDEEGPVEL